MNTPRRWLAGLWIATVAIGAALLTGGLGFADWGNEEPHPGPMGPGMGAFHCPMWGEGRSAGTRFPMAPSGMGARHYFSTGEEMPISLDEAVGIAQAYLDQAMPGAVADPEVAAFYGYYTVYVLKDGQITGMLSVNGFTGQVWPHSWHGEFLGREER